jgi:hypothetical protein
MRIVNQAFRLYVEPGQLESTIAFYESIQGKPCERRIVIAEAGIEVAVVGGFILLAGNAQALTPVRDAQAVLMVDSLDEFAPWLQANGAIIVTPSYRYPVELAPILLSIRRPNASYWKLAVLSALALQLMLVRRPCAS